MKDAVLGGALTALLAVILWLVWGAEAALAGVQFGALATVLDVMAVALMRRGLAGDFKRTVAHWAMGLGLRLVGVALLISALLLAPERYPALPSAIGFAGVLLPLLFYEMRLFL